MMDNKEKFINIISYGTTDVPDFLLKFAGITRTPDVMPVMFKLVHANRNQNKDEFTEEEMLSALKTVDNKALNWEHTEEVIGSMINAFFLKVRDGAIEKIISSKDDQEVIKTELASISQTKELSLNEEQNKQLLMAMARCSSEANLGVEEFLNIKKDEKSSILVIGVVWAQRNPDRAEEMSERSAAGNLAWSMETFYKGFKCSECATAFASSEDECEHLENRHALGSNVGRILTGLNFCGAATVKRPADSQAQNVALGKNIKKEEELMTYKTFETEKEFDTHVAEILEKSNLSVKVSELEATVATLAGKLDTAIAENESLTEANTEAKASNVLLTEDLAGKAVLLTELTDRINEFESATKLRLGLARLAELVTAGLKVSDETKDAMVEKLSNEDENSYEMLKKIILASFVIKEDEVKENKTVATVPDDLTEDLKEGKAEAKKEDKVEKMDALEIVLAKSAELAKVKR